MEILLYTNLNCKECLKHVLDIQELLKRYLLEFKIFDLDNEAYYLTFLRALSEYNIHMIPSLVIKHNNTYTVIDGIENSIEKTKNKIDEIRNRI